MKGMRVSLLMGVATLALANLPARAATVDDVIKAGVLRVCTPGDYRPFSFALPDGTFEGLDVDLMQSLTASLGVKAEFVKTTWANLLPDFVARKCDIAVGGISVTLERQNTDTLAAFEALACAHDAVQQCWRVAPGPDFILVLACRDMSHYQQIGQALFTNHSNVRNAKAFFATKRAKFSTHSAPLAL